MSIHLTMVSFYKHFVLLPGTILIDCVTITLKYICLGGFGHVFDIKDQIQWL